MSFTNKTPNYNLPQWLGTDKPSWLVDVNGAFSSIDTAIKNAADSGSGADATARAALETAQTAQNTSNSALEQADNANTKADRANVTAGNAQTAAGGAVSTANEALANSETALAYGNWQKRLIAANDMVVIEEVTKASQPSYAQFIFIYNKQLNLMEFSGAINITTINTLTKYVEVTANGVTFRAFPVYKLPFSCTGSMLINTTPLFEGNNQGSGNNKIIYGRNCTACITMYNNSAWMCYVVGTNTTTTTFTDEPLARISASCLWLQTSSLGTITLDGWEPVS